jgi:CDI toxin RNase A-like protein
MVEVAESVRLALGRPMPVAGAATVRSVAARAAELAGELDRVLAVLSGGQGRRVGWAGQAELAFQESLAGELARFAPAVRRLEDHALALAGYARELDRLDRPLRAARARLADGSAAGTAEFERCWQDWDAARRRCAAGLAAGIPPHRHGVTGLVSAVSQSVHHGVRLADLSHALGDLGQALVGAGLVLALVCPPAAGAVWAAVAVVAACQLAVDLARRHRGEHIGLAGLGWDALAALPAGRFVHSAAEASAAIERLTPELRSVRLAPGGGLKIHEGTATHRGHTLLKHVGKRSKQLTKRFKNEPWLQFSSSFTDRATAETAVAKAIEDNHHAIATWLASPLPTLRIQTDVGSAIGISVARSGTIISASKVRVALRKEDTVLGYYIKTAFPTP